MWGTRPGLTRRALLQGAAAGGVAQLLAPAPGLAAPPGPGHTVFSRWVGALSGLSAEFDVATRFTLAGVRWAGPSGARIELRARRDGGPWSRWGIASTAGHGPDGAPARTLVGEPLCTGPADSVQLRTSAPIRDVTLHFVDVAIPASARSATAAAGLPLAQPRLDAGPGQPPIIARSAWAGRGAPPAVAPGYGRVEMAFVHHTDSLNDYSPDEVPAMVQGIYAFHRFTNGWHDIGYNFVIDLYGRIWEARSGGIDQAVVGAQAGGYNTESTGVAILGTFSAALPSAPAMSALERLLAWKLSVHGVPTSGMVTVVVNPADYYYTPFAPGAHVSLPRVAGHRQGCTTDCPGDALYGELPAVRRRVSALAGPLHRLTLTAPANVTVAGSHIGLSGRLTSEGRPVAGAAVEIQALHAAVGGPRETMLGTVITATDGRWSTQIAPPANTLVRALHRSAPATTSPLVALAVSPQVTVEVLSTTPLSVQGAIVPAKRAATVTLYGQRHDRLVRLQRKKVTAHGGAFLARFGTRPSGSYVVLVTTAADAVNAAGRSTPLTVSIP